jgi:hypothetical protein
MGERRFLLLVICQSDTPNEIMKTNSRSSSAEGLRMIRTNLEFMLGKVPEGAAKTIFITSTFPKKVNLFQQTWLPLLPYQVKKCC